MNRRASCVLVPCLIAVFVVSMSSRVVAEDSLATARELYSSASYEEALTILNRLRAASVPGEESPAIEQYRAFCLMALGRSDEALRAIEALIMVAPAYRPSDADVAPRVRSTFSDARRRLLPGIIQQKYAQAKTAFDQKEYTAAADAFTQVLKLLADSDVAAAASKPPLSDLRTLAVGFQELSAKASLPALPVPAPTPVPTSVVVAQPAPDRAPLPLPVRIYSAGDANVVPPVIVQQQLPPFNGRVAVRTRGVLEVVVDENGAVESAAMREAAHATYDRLVLEAARKWRYKPATADGKPIKFRKFVQITLEP
jgi:TonB family protein